jgi:hypothetical protein
MGPAPRINRRRREQPRGKWLDTPAAEMNWEQPHAKPLAMHLSPRCGAYARRTGQRCRNGAMANGQCRMHGGNRRARPRATRPVACGAAKEKAPLRAGLSRGYATNKNSVSARCGPSITDKAAAWETAAWETVFACSGLSLQVAPPGSETPPSTKRKQWRAAAGSPGRANTGALPVFEHPPGGVLSHWQKRETPPERNGGNLKGGVLGALLDFSHGVRISTWLGNTVGAPEVPIMRVNIYRPCYPDRPLRDDTLPATPADAAYLSR